MSPSPTSRLRRSLACRPSRSIRSSLRSLDLPARRRWHRRGRAASHTETVSLAARPPSLAGARSRRSISSSPQSASHCPTCGVRETQALVRELLAQELELVGREIDDQQAPARRQHAGRLAHGALRVAQEVQHLVHHARRRPTGRRAADRRCRPAAPGRARPAALELGARVGQHGRAQIDAEAASIALAEQLEHAARPGAEVDERDRTDPRPAPRKRRPQRPPRPRAARGCCPIRPAWAWK